MTAWWVNIHTVVPSKVSRRSLNRVRIRNTTSHQLSPDGGW